MLIAFVSVVGNSVMSGEIAPGVSQAALGQTAYYRNCDTARAAGVAPLHVGEPGYREPLDADGDGIACEPYQGF